MQLVKLLTSAVLLVTAGQASPVADTDIATSSHGEVASIRNYFYIGGGYADDGKGGHIFRDQMYVEHLKPVNGGAQKTPIVIIHGQAQTGTVSFSFFCFASISQLHKTLRWPHTHATWLTPNPNETATSAVISTSQNVHGLLNFND